jgi:flagellin
MAMNAYRNYNTNTSALSSNLEKLSSGYKINRAGDDAAGLAISEKMRAQISGLEQASSNVKDGISLVKTAEGAMQEVQDMLNRMVTLATQSANGTYDETVDRDNLQKEVDQLTAEINRIADSANFNGIKLLDGSLDAGATTGGSTVDLSGVLKDVSERTASVAAGTASFSVSLNGYSIAGASANDTFKLKVGDQTIESSSIGAAGTASASDIAAKFSGKSVTLDGIKYAITTSGDKLTFTATAAPASEGKITHNFAVKLTYAGTSGTESGSVNTNAQVITNGIVAETGKEAKATLTLGVNLLDDGNTIQIGEQKIKIDYSSTSVSGTTVGVKDLLTDGKLTTDALAAVGERITQAAGTNTMFTVGFDGASKLTFQSLDTYNPTNDEEGKVDLRDPANVKAQFSVTKATGTGSSLQLQIGDTSDSYNQLSVSIQDIHASSLGIADISIATQSGAQAAIDKIKNAINTVSSVRGTLGATQNRLEHTSNNLSVMTENIQDAESTIRDTDIAEEMMSYTKNNILVQSAQAMLAQANSVPQGVLQLLQ